jgi:hypothetical protein
MGDGKPWENGPQAGRIGCGVAFLFMVAALAALAALSTLGGYVVLHG